MKKNAESKKLSLRLLVVMMLFGALAMGGVAGMFVYATGAAVIEDGFSMKMVSHTEYRFNEPGQIVARLVDFQGNAVNVNNCTATILYPDKTKFVDEALMSDTGNITGDHYYAFTTPASGPEGVYEYQATCVWNGGARSQSVTNSFHLSSAFTSVLGNLTDIQKDLTAVQGNLTELSNELAAVNSSLSGDIADLSTQLNTNISTVLTELSNVNSSLSTQLTDLSTQLSDTNSTLYQAIANITAEAFNYTIITNAIGALEANIAANFTALNGRFDLVDGNLSFIIDQNTAIDGNLSVVLTNQEAMNATLVDIQSTVDGMSTVLDTVDTMTTNTYNYVTGTLANNVQQVLDDLGVMNATLNRVETVTNQINSTVTDILANQEAEVYMTTFSG